VGCFLRVVGWTVAVALVIVIAWVAILAFYLSRGHNPPDVAGIARSQPVAGADQVATSATSAAFAALPPDGASWLVPGPTAVSDLCTSRQYGEFVVAWEPATCMRRLTAYFFFNGSFQQHMRAWDAALRATGWSATGYPLGRPLGYYTEYGHKPEPSEPSQTYLATSLPASEPYYRALPGPPAPGHSISLVFNWAERPEVTPPYADTDTFLEPDATTAVAWIEKEPVSPDAVEAAAFARYQFVAVATLTATYYDAAAPAQAPATHPAREACRSGSGTCD
jgi:hypothetical protein